MRSTHSSAVIPACLALAVALLARGMAAEPPASTGPAPALEIHGETTQDGGTVEQGTILKYHFVVANKGKADLEIKEVKPSCGCTVPHWDKLIQAGKEGAIDAEVNTTHFRGAIAKHLTVLSNDPTHPQLELSLTAKVSPLVEITPGEVALITVEDKPVTQEFTLERAKGQSMKVLDVTSAQPFVKTEVTPLSGPGHYKVTVTISPDAPMGRTPTPLTVRTDMDKAPTFTLTLIVDRGIVIMPAMVFFNPAAGPLTTPMQAAVTLMRQKNPFHVKSATADDEKLQAKVDMVRDGLEYRITVSYKGGWDKGPIQKELTLTTDDPKQPEIKIPVRGVVQ